MEIVTSSEPPSGPHVLGILMTAKCNIVCRHCCNDSHPLNATTVPFEQIAHAIEMACDVPSIKEVGISGGEPFLFVPLLLRIIEFAATKGFTSSVTTNGSWGKHSERASTLLSQLKAAGLRAINISTSKFHQEFVDMATICTSITTALSVGLKVTLNVVSSRSLSVDGLRAALGDLANDIEMVVMPCVPAGRGGAHVAADEFIQEYAVPRGNCTEHFRKVAIDVAGDVYPCCSPGGFTPPLRLGNVRNASLGSILEASTQNKLLAILESVGPQYFLPFLRRSAHLHPSLPDKFSDQCHLCNVMLSSERYREVIKSAADQLITGLATTATPGEGSTAGERMSKLIGQRRL
jgi:MoaA/NifB/PqqE/SkfB family radical SAM enzyme